MPVLATAPGTTATGTAIMVPGAWATYRNDRVGYTVDYPAPWAVDERAGAGGVFSTTFAPPGGGARVEIAVQPGDAGGGDGGEIPNAPCQPVTVGGLPARHCFDTLSFATTTTLSARGKTYTIATVGKFPDQAVYQRFLDSFALLP